MNSPFAAALIAGGRSARFGSDKAFHRVGGDTPLWRHQLAKIDPLMPAETLISANAEQRFETSYRVVVDDAPDLGPLGALASCLRATALDRLLVLAVDMPDMSTNLLGELAYCDCGVVPHHADGMPEPLAAVYPRGILDLAESQLAAGRLAMRDLVRLGVAAGLLVPRPIAQDELPLFCNLNRPTDA